MALITEEKYTFKHGTFIYENIFSAEFPTFKKVTQSLGFVLNSQNQILFTSDDNHKWEMPGGTIEKGETITETLIREVYEETAVVIDKHTIQPFFYTNLYKVVSNLRVYQSSQVRFIARIDKMDKFIKDPGGNRAYIRFADVEDFDKVFAWEGKNIKDQLILRLTELKWI